MQTNASANNQTAKVSSTALYLRLLSYTRRYTLFFAISVLGFTLFAGMEALMGHMMKYFIEGLETRDQQLMIWVPVAIVLARIMHGLGSYLGNFYISRLGLGVVNDLRKELFKRMVYLPNKFYDEHNSGELVSLIVYNVQQITASLTQAIKIAFRDGFTIIALVSYLFWVDWTFTLIFLIMAPILAGLVAIASRYFRKVSRRMQVTMGDITHVANESLQGFELVKSFNGQKFEVKRFNKASDHNTELSTKFERVSALQGPIYHFVIALSLAVILFLILAFWEKSTGSAVAYLTVAAMIAKPIRSLSSLNAVIQRGLAAAETIFATIDSKPEPDKYSTPLDVKQGRIEFKNVSFSYDDKARALDNINLVIEPGQTVALVGKSGSGKSTLTSLLLRFYDYQEGEILVDGQSIQNVSLTSLRKNIALVNQHTVLFNESLLENIAYATLPEDISDQKIQAVCKQAHINEFVDALPNGLNELAGENGSRLSGGQRQRISVARAIFKDAPLLVLDEATSALDSESENAIQDELETIQKNRTTLIVAHRLSTIESADKIIVMNEGQIVEEGKHQDLLQKGGYYASLHALQFSS